MRPDAFANDRRAVPALIVAASAAILLAALGFQYIGGLQPCVLCIWQRWPYVGAIVVGAVAFGLAGRPAAAWLVLLAGLLFVADAGIAAFHVGVEQHWWQGTAECGGSSIDVNASVEEIGKQLMATPVVRCDEIPWSLFGISMAGYNFMLALLLAAFSFVAGRRMLGGRQ